MKNKSVAVPTEIIFLFSFLFFFLSFSDHAGLFSIQGDSICQLAYWKILFRPELTGSLSASQTKPAQVILLGLAYSLAPYVGMWGVRLVFSGLAAGLATVLTRISLNLGGRVAGLFTWFLALSEHSNWFQRADSVLGYTFCLYTGLWFYYYSKPERRPWGLLLLFAMLLFRIEGVAVLGMMGLLHLRNREWKPLAFLSVGSVLILSFWLFFVLKIQGEFSRLDSGAGAGYFSYPDVGSAHWFRASLHYARGALRLSLSEQGNPLKWALALLGLVWVARVARPFRYFFLVWSTVAILLANVVVLGGSIQTRYLVALMAFGLAFGVPALVTLLRDWMTRWDRRVGWGVAWAACCILIYFPVLRSWGGIQGYLHPESVPLSSALAGDAHLILGERIIPRGVRLLTEDDAIYAVLMLDEKAFTRFHSLQSFNILTEDKRRKILEETDYIYFSKLGNYTNYYVHNIKPDGASDPFRREVEKMIRFRKSGEIYGHSLILVSDDSQRTILKVTKTFP